MNLLSVGLCFRSVQICSHIHGTDCTIQDFMKDMEVLARFAMPSSPSASELDRLCADFEEKVSDILASGFNKDRTLPHR